MFAYRLGEVGLRTVALFTQQVGHYHNARYRAAASLIDRLVVVSVTSDAAFPEFLAASSVGYDVVSLFESYGRYRKAVSSGELWARTRATLAEISPDVIVVAGWTTAESAAAIAWGHERRLPIVLMSESQATDARRVAHRELAKGRVVRCCQAALVGGRTHKDYVVELGMPESQVFLGYDVVDNQHFSEGAKIARSSAIDVRAQLRLPVDYLLASARFIPKKNLPSLVTAFGAARANAVGTELVILGDGEQRPVIEAAIRRAGLGGAVHLVGFQAYDQLPAYYGLARAFVHVSTSEQWGLVINEAAAAGLPVIASSVCGAAVELVDDGRNGFVVDPSNQMQIQAAIARVLTLAPSHQAEMGRISQDIVGRWGPERFAAGLMCACRAAISTSQRRLAPWDAALLRVLGRQEVSGVS